MLDLIWLSRVSILGLSMSRPPPPLFPNVCNFCTPLRSHEHLSKIH